MINLLQLSHSSNFCQEEYSYDQPDSGYKLEYATIIFKHGIHAPIDKIPGHDITWNCSNQNWLYPGGDPMDEEVQFKHQFHIQPIYKQSFLKGTCRAGELIEKGVDQVKKLSEWISAHYSSLFSKDFPTKKISWRSTYTNRCLASLQSLAHFLFPGTDPIEVFVANEELESLVPNSYLCPALGDKIKELLDKNSSFSLSLNQYNSKFEEAQKRGNFTAAPKWPRMAELIFTQYCATNSYPDGIDQEFAEEAANILLEFYKQLLGTEETLKYGSGLLLSEIYLGIRDYLAGNSRSPLAIVSAHTLTFVSLLTSLGIQPNWPAYASVLSFELWSKGSDFQVRILHQGKQIILMTLQEFEKKALSLRPSESECRIVYPYIEKNKKDQGIKLLQMSFS